MSVKVDLAALADTMTDYSAAYLLTVSEAQRPHAVAVDPHLHGGGTLAVRGLGRTTMRNLVDRPEVTLLFPPTEPGGYSLIVDGRATATGEGADVAPEHAVLHRPADHAAGPGESSCGNDCRHLPAS